MRKILGIGNALVDVLLEIENDNLLKQFELPKGGMVMISAEKKNEIHSKIAGLPQKIVSGGSNSNTIYALAQLGAKVGYIGKIGNDQMGEFFKNDMAEVGVNTHLSYSDLDTGIATTFISKGGERTFATYLGAAANQTVEELNEEIISLYDLIHVEGYLIFNEELILSICKLAKKCGLLISMDMASYNLVEMKRTLFEELLQNYVDIIFANEDEALAFTGKYENEAVEALAKYCKVAIVKLGARGSLVHINEKTTVIEPVPANCVDMTGAGDIFAAGFLYGVINDYNAEQCGALASKLGAKCVETIGARIIMNNEL